MDKIVNIAIIAHVDHGKTPSWTIAAPVRTSRQPKGRDRMMDSMI